MTIQLFSLHKLVQSVLIFVCCSFQVNFQVNLFIPRLTKSKQQGQAISSNMANTLWRFAVAKYRSFDTVTAKMFVLSTFPCTPLKIKGYSQ